MAGVGHVRLSLARPELDVGAAVTGQALAICGHLPQTLVWLHGLQAVGLSRVMRGQAAVHLCVEWLVSPCRVTAPSLQHSAVSQP